MSTTVQSRPAPESAALAARVESLRAATQTVMVMRLRLPSPGALRWRPGQYIRVECSRGKRRPFSVANAPTDLGVIELHIRFSPDSSFSHEVFGALRVGDSLRVDGPYGAMRPCAHAERPVLLVAGGVGLAPMNAMLEHYLALDEARSIALYWGVDHLDDLYLDARFRALARRHARFLYVPVLLDGGTRAAACAGFVHEAVLRDHPSLSRHHVHVGGPTGMVAACRSAFPGRGLPLERLDAD